MKIIKKYEKDGFKWKEIEYKNKIAKFAQEEKTNQWLIQIGDHLFNIDDYKVLKEFANQKEE